MNALDRLIEGNDRYLKCIEDEQIRDGLIQRYKFTYEISYKILKRYMEMSSANPEIYDSMQFSEMIRSANEMSLLKSDWSHWKIFREMRTKSSLAFDEKAAIEVVSIVADFIDEATFLLSSLKLKNA
jgi:nucleotidyltransferase substrate binding protein (TIGR01987 family)